jgi:hypothetical protein
MAGPKAAKQPKRFAHAKSPLQNKTSGKSSMRPTKVGENMLKIDKDDAPNKSDKKKR